MNNALNLSKIALAVAAIAAVLPTVSHAGSATVSNAGAGALTTNASLDFTVVIPKVLFLRVGTGGLFGAASDATIDGITFTVAAANLGSGTAQAGVGGDLTAGAVSALLRSNAGAVTLTANTTGALTNATADTIPWSQIGIASSNLTTPSFANSLPHVGALPNTGASANFAPAAVGKVTNVGSTWTFNYLNASTAPFGTYGGSVANNGRVTYTASVL